MLSMASQPLVGHIGEQLLSPLQQTPPFAGLFPPLPDIKIKRRKIRLRRFSFQQSPTRADQAHA